MKKLYAMPWLESESGWGTRPDGYSFHASLEECDQFIKEYWDKQPAQCPAEYSRPNAKTPILVDVSDSLHQYVFTYGSVWLYNNNISSYQTFDANTLKNKGPR